jgi:hypothetical protein
MMKQDCLPSLANRRRMTAWMLFGVVVLAVIAIKSFNDGWFEPKTPLALNGEPALVFFNLGRGCECQMTVIRSAEAQLAAWPVALEDRIHIIRVDFSRRPDLARQYDIARAPALVLLDSNGEVVWKQDVGLSDDAPLDLEQAKDQVELLLSEESQ